MHSKTSKFLDTIVMAYRLSRQTALPLRLPVGLDGLDVISVVISALESMTRSIQSSCSHYNAFILIFAENFSCVGHNKHELLVGQIVWWGQAGML